MLSRKAYIWLAEGFIVLAALVGLYALYAHSDSIARLLWKHYLAGPALMADQHDPALAMQIGMLEFGVKDYNLALAEQGFQTALRIAPKTLWGHYELARIDFVKGDFAGALKEADAELAANPENLRTLYVRGLTYASMGRLADAEADFNRFIFWAPTEWAGYNDFSYVLAKDGKYRQAWTVADLGMKTATGGATNPWLWNSLGVADLNRGNAVRAAAEFQSAAAYAAMLTADDWHTAYPGNDPAQDEAGLRAFRDAIAQNLTSVQGKAN